MPAKKEKGVGETPEETAETPEVNPATRDLVQDVPQEQGVKHVQGKPRIIGGICEHCGVPAAKCEHHAKPE